MLTIEYAKNPQWSSKDQEQIFLMVKFVEFAEEFPFNATAFDTEAHGVTLFNRAKAGEFGEVAPYVEQDIS